MPETPIFGLNSPVVWMTKRQLAERAVAGGQLALTVTPMASFLEREYGERGLEAHVASLLMSRFWFTVAPDASRDGLEARLYVQGVQAGKAFLSSTAVLASAGKLIGPEEENRG